MYKAKTLEEITTVTSTNLKDASAMAIKAMFRQAIQDVRSELVKAGKTDSNLHDAYIESMHLCQDKFKALTGSYLV